MKNKKTILVLVIILIISVSIFMVLYCKLFNKDKKPKENIPVDIIKNFNYELEERDTSLFKDEYLKLKDILSKDEIDYIEYAKQIAKLYIIDLYTINNKKNIYDCGSLEYIYPDIKENFELKVKDTLYKYIENDTGNRKQLLPQVSTTSIDECIEDSLIFNGKTMPSYNIKISWDYIEDLGYDKVAELILVQEDGKIYILEQK